MTVVIVAMSGDPVPQAALIDLDRVADPAVATALRNALAASPRGAGELFDPTGYGIWNAIFPSAEVRTPFTGTVLGSVSICADI